MATVKNNTSAGNNVSINQVSNGTSGTTNISVGGKITINDVEYECVTSKSGNTKFYPKGDYHKMKQAQQATGNYNAYADGRYTNTYPSENQWPGKNPYKKGDFFKRATQESYEDWKRLKEKKKSEEPQDQVEDGLVDSMRETIHHIRKSTVILDRKLIEIKVRESELIARELELVRLQDLHHKRHVSVTNRDMELESLRKQLNKLELDLVEREAVIEEWEKLHATPNTASEGPNDVRKRASRL